MSRAKEISRDTLVLSISQYASQAANVLKGSLLAKYWALLPGRVTQRPRLRRVRVGLYVLTLLGPGNP